MSDEIHAQVDTQQSPDDIREEIERTRAELAETVDELTERLNVKPQAQIRTDAAKAAVTEKLEVAKHAAGDTVAAAKPYQTQIVSVAAGVGALVTLLLVLRKVRSRD